MATHMFRYPRAALLGLAMSLTLEADVLADDWTEHPCYGRAMVGQDSVINARLGVPAEHALAVVGYGREPQTGDRADVTEFLKIIWNAYSWEDSPYEYSQMVFRQCTLEGGKVSMLSAGGG